MPEARPKFFKAFALKLAAWLRVVAARLEARKPNNDAVLPPRAPGPPAHWVERIKEAAPELLEPGPANFRAAAAAGDFQPPGPKPMPRAHPIPAPSAPRPPAGPVRTTLRNLWLALSRSAKAEPSSSPESIAAEAKVQPPASYPLTKSAQPSGTVRFPFLAARAGQDAPIAVPEHLDSPAPRAAARADLAPRAHPFSNRTPPVRLRPGPVLASLTRSESQRDSSPELGNRAPNRVRPVARLTPLAETPQDTSKRDATERAVVSHQTLQREQRSSRPAWMELRPEPPNFPDSPIYPPLPQGKESVTTVRLADRPATRPTSLTSYPPSTGPVRTVSRAAEREQPERWPALPGRPEGEAREDWLAWQREQQHRAQLNLEQRGLPWTA